MMDTIDIDIVCPLYNAEKYIEALIEGIKKQKNVDIKGIHFFLTESTDNSKGILDSLGIEYEVIKKKDFSHSRIRALGISKAISNNVILISQDVNLVDEYAFSLLAGKLDDKCAFAYGRQIALRRHIERYVREYNYPQKSHVYTKSDIEEKQIKAFFASDAFSAVNKSVFLSLNGYDGLDLNINEDMYYARKILLNDFSLAYVSEAVVEHYHDLKVKEIYSRYYEVGKFFRTNHLFDEYKKNSSALRLAFYVFFKALIHFDVKALFMLCPNMLARFLGMRKGKKK